MRQLIITIFLLTFSLAFYAQDALVIHPSEKAGHCYFLHNIHHIKKNDASWVIVMHSGEEYSYPLTSTTFIYQIMHQPEYNAIDAPENPLNVYYDVMESTIVFEDEVNGSVFVFDISGRVVLQQPSLTSKRIYVGNLPLGVYILQAENKVVKFIKS